jgi:hypothetical protein
LILILFEHLYKASRRGANALYRCMLLKADK